MNHTDRIQAFISLGQALQSLSKTAFEALAKKAYQENGWFTEASVALAFKGMQVMLQAGPLEAWSASYQPEPATSRTVGVAMAGNIPLVGFHDFMAVLIAGHRLVYKPSSKDTILLDALISKLLAIEPRFADRIRASERLNDVDAIIATGSDNTSRYFEYYFRHVPHIIRRNRVSCAVIEGDEPAEEVAFLGNDIFSYYGLGCRNVSFVFLPRELDLKNFLQRLEEFRWVMENHKYVNNYTYQNSLAMLNQEKYLDNGFLLLKESDKLVSPVSVLHYAFYDDLEALQQRMGDIQEKLQVIVSAKGWFPGSVPFGTAQFPEVSDYADRVDTMKFLHSL